MYLIICVSFDQITFRELDQGHTHGNSKWVHVGTGPITAHSQARVYLYIFKTNSIQVFALYFERVI